jgi:hypothetical protein
MEVISIVLMIDADGFIAVLFCGGDSLQDIFCFHVQDCLVMFLLYLQIFNKKIFLIQVVDKLHGACLWLRRYGEFDKIMYFF